MTESFYLEKLTDPSLYLDAPLPVEISGGPGNYVATWMETKIEGEGKTKEAAVADVTKAILERYRVIEKKYMDGERVATAEESVWIALTHYIADARRGRIRPGEEGSMRNPTDPDYKGPIFG